MVSLNSTDKVIYKEGDVTIVESTAEHAGYLQHHLRPSDIRECMIHGATPWRALHLPLRHKTAETYTGFYKDEPACMVGVYPYDQEHEFKMGSIWLLGTYVLDENPRQFLRASKFMADMFLEKYDMLENVVPLEHSKTIRWLHWLGFEFGTKPIEINGFEVIRFVRCDTAIEVRFE